MDVIKRRTWHLIDTFYQITLWSFSVNVLRLQHCHKTTLWSLNVLQLKASLNVKRSAFSATPLAPVNHRMSVRAPASHCCSDHMRSSGPINFLNCDKESRLACPVLYQLLRLFNGVIIENHQYFHRQRVNFVCTFRKIPPTNQMGGLRWWRHFFLYWTLRFVDSQQVPSVSTNHGAAYISQCVMAGWWPCCR